MSLGYKKPQLNFENSHKGFSTDPPAIQTSRGYLRQLGLSTVNGICELCIDVTSITVKSLKLSLPKTSNQSFVLLHEAGVIDVTLLPKLKGMVGFRNVVIHEYTKLDINTLVDVIENGIDTRWSSCTR